MMSKNNTIKVAIVGAAGRMGKRLCALAATMDAMELAGAVETAGHPAIGRPAADGSSVTITDALPEACYLEEARLITFGALLPPPGSERHHVAVVCAGTSDIPVAEECAGTLAWAGIEVARYFDIGVARLERLLEVEDALRRASVCVVVAGMEGALPTVVGGRIACPVIAVPTSVGYGANLNGLSALLGMLTSCVPGVTVVNIDNGFGAAAAANRMLRLALASADGSRARPS